jgi:uncharacterized Fe-S cluster protein YjdI
MTAKDYQAGDVVVSFDGDVCIHSEECVRGLPKVFNTSARPWIQPGNASPEEVRDAIARCPSGALQFRRVNNPTSPSPSPAPSPAPGGQGAAPGVPAGVRVTVKPNGPYLVQGPSTVCDVAGTVIKEGTMFALCRCGQSGAKPFCDGTHGRVGWRS